MKKTPLKMFETILITFGLLLAAFYLFVLKPKLELPLKLLAAEEVVATNYFNLLQNRLGIVGLGTLEPNTGNLGNKKSYLLAEALKTNEVGLKKLEQPLLTEELENVTNFSSQELFDENKRILEEQKSLLEQLQTLGQINKNIFSYRPVDDIGRLDLADDDEKEKILTRMRNAIEGIGDIEKNLAEHSEKEYINEMQEEIFKTQDLMRKQTAEIEAGEYKTASKTFLEVFNNFTKLRELGLDAEKAFIHSPESIQLITDQSNLLLKYEFLFEKINVSQGKLSEVDLYSLF